MSRTYTAAEELAHWVSAAMGAVACLAGLPWLVVVALQHGRGLLAAASALFAVSALLMFLTSAIYHAARPGPAKARLRTIDHASIFLLIAATYTPFTLSVLDGRRGAVLLAAVWLLALGGMLAKVTGRLRSHILSSAIYVGLGWIGVANLPELESRMAGAAFGWLLAGGLAYTLGVLFYVWKSRPFTHAIWHGFVAAGVGCHFLAVLGVVSA